MSKSREQLITQMLEDDPDDGERTITSHFLDDKTTAGPRRHNTSACTSRKAKPLPAKASSATANKPSYTPNRADNDGFGSKELISIGRNLPPVAELEIRDTESIADDLTEHTFGTMPMPTVGYQRYNPYLEEHREERESYSGVGVDYGYGFSTRRFEKEADAAPSNASRAEAAPPSVTESMTENSDGALGSGTGSGRGSVQKDKKLQNSNGRTKKKRRACCIACSCLVAFLIAIGIVVAVWHRSIFDAAKSAIGRIDGGGGGGDSDKKNHKNGRGLHLRRSDNRSIRDRA
jgi:hypothetical protein